MSHDTQILTVPALLADGMQIPSIETAPCPGERCAITGEPIECGVPVQEVVTGATSEFLDTFRGGLHGFVSEAAARLYSVSAPRIKHLMPLRPGGQPQPVSNSPARSHLAFEDGAYWSPTVSRESASEHRACWSDVVREVWPARAGQRCIVLLTDDFKRRLWPYARASVLGQQTCAFVQDSAFFSLSGLLRIDWAAMLSCLDLVERVYTLGFPKDAIRYSLFGTSKATAAVGLAETLALERQVAAWRERPEFKFVLIIAQKGAIA